MPIFSKNQQKIWRNKPKYPHFFSIGVDFFLKKIANISPPTDISPIFGKTFGYLFRRHFAPLFRFVDARNAKFQRNFEEKNRHFQPWYLENAFFLGIGLRLVASFKKYSNDMYLILVSLVGNS